MNEIVRVELLGLFLPWCALAKAAFCHCQRELLMNVALGIAKRVRIFLAVVVI